MKNKLLVASMALLMTAGLSQMQAQISVRIGPPPPEHEVIPPPPHRGAVWVHGYHRWDGNRYVWTPGEYRDPPHGHGRWVDGHWDHRRGGYVWVEGHWR